MIVLRVRKEIVLLTSAAFLSGCDPAAHVSYEKDFAQAVDLDCAERVLSAENGGTSRGAHVAEAGDSHGFTPGTTVSQIDYGDRPELGYYALQVADRDNRGLRHVWHGWDELGVYKGGKEQKRAVARLEREHRLLEKRCGISFAGVPATMDLSSRSLR